MVIVSAEEVVELTLSRPELVIIDSRKKTEYTKGHIEGAVNLLNTVHAPRGYGDPLSRTRPRRLFSTATASAACGVPTPSSKAMGWGYRNVFWFRGGWKEWTDKRLPVITD